MIRALFFDIDGTLVSFRTHAIPASTVRAIEAAKAQGLYVFIATGRPFAIINNLQALESRHLIDGYITMNGAYCFAGGEVIYKGCMHPHDTQALMDFCLEKGRSNIVVHEKSICVCRPDDMVRQVFHEFLHVDVLPEATPEEALSGGDIYQMTPFISVEEQREIAPQLALSEIGRWHPAFADITGRDNTKQRGIDQVIRRFGVQIEETMAFGDGGNDMGMLRHAGIGVAMGNAAHDVKAAARYVTTSVDDDGVASALKHFGVIQ